MNRTRPFTAHLTIEVLYDLKSNFQKDRQPKLCNLVPKVF